MNTEMSQRRYSSLERIDAMPRELRECVHEFGLPIVEVLVKHGVRRPAAIREIVKDVWAGARQEGQKNSAYGTLEWLLMQSGSQMSVSKFKRFLRDNNLVLAPVSPTREMINASIAEVSGHNIRCTRDEKHRRRLVAALRAAPP